MKVYIPICVWHRFNELFFMTIQKHNTSTFSTCFRNNTELATVMGRKLNMVEKKLERPTIDNTDH